MDRSAAEPLQRYLEDGEWLLWSGRPTQGIKLRPYDAFLIPFSALWCLGVIFWEAGVLKYVMQGDHPESPRAVGWVFLAVGVLFVLIGLHMMVARFVIDAWRRRRTSYGVTGRRVLILSGYVHPTLKSLDPRTLPEFTVQEENDGSGTILFASTPPQLSILGRTWPLPGRLGCDAFEMIPEVRNVCKIIDGLRAG